MGLSHLASLCSCVADADSPCDPITAQARAIVCGGLNQSGYDRSLAGDRSKLCWRRGKIPASALLKNRSDAAPLVMDGRCSSDSSQHATRPGMFEVKVVPKNGSDTNENVSKCAYVNGSSSRTLRPPLATTHRPTRQRHAGSHQHREQSQQWLYIDVYCQR